MHLPHMTAADLDNVCVRLTAIAEALRGLQGDFPGVFVDLTPDQAAVIRLPVVLGSGDPGPVEIVDMTRLRRGPVRVEADSLTRFSDFIAETGSSFAQGMELEIAPEDGAALPDGGQEDSEKLGGDRLDPAENDPVQAADATADIAAPSAAEAAPADEAAAGAEASSAPAPPARAPVEVKAPASAPLAAGELLSGPLSEAEKEKILSMHRAGHPNGVIAAYLRRRVHTVSLFVSRPATRALLLTSSPAADEGFRPLGEVAAVVVADAAAQMAQAPVPEAAPVVEAAPEPLPEALPEPLPEAAPQPAPEPLPEALPEPAVVRAVAPGGLPPDLSAEERRIWVYLDNLGYKGIWNADLDHELVEMLVGGTKAAQVALDLAIDAGAVKSRWVHLSACILDDKARPTITGQKHLLAVLKARLIRARG